MLNIFILLVTKVLGQSSAVLKNLTPSAQIWQEAIEVAMEEPMEEDAEEAAEEVIHYHHHYHHYHQHLMILPLRSL